MIIKCWCYLFNKKAVIEYIFNIFKDTGIFSDIQLNWFDSILNRTDGMDGLDQLTRITQFCVEYNNKKTIFTPYENYLASKRILEVFNSCLSLYVVQKKVIIGVPQRQPYQNCIAPNLKGLIASQPFPVDVVAAFGMGYCESRTYLVERALNDSKNTHILLIDDDMLVPANIVALLMNKQEPIIGANYSKKNWAIESTATYPGLDKNFVYANQTVPFNENMDVPIVTSGMGLGCVLIDLNVFKNLEKPWFKFEIENGKVLKGEDFYFFHKALAFGYNPKIIPNLVCPHVDFKTGKYYGPSWLIKPDNSGIHDTHKQYYTDFVCDPVLLSNKDQDLII